MLRDQITVSQRIPVKWTDPDDERRYADAVYLDFCPSINGGVIRLIKIDVKSFNSFEETSLTRSQLMNHLSWYVEITPQIEEDIADFYRRVAIWKLEND